MANLFDCRFRKKNTGVNQAYSMDADMLNLLMVIDDSKTIRQVAQEVQMSQEAFKATLAKLYKLGLIEQTHDGMNYVDAAFFDFMREALIQLVGPLGDVLVDDTAEESGFEIDRMPQTKLASFVTAVAQEIPGEKQCNEFKKIMLERMKKQGIY